MNWSYVIGIVAVVASASGVEAVAAAQGTHVEVRTHDLDLASESGQRRLDGRLKVAARRVCGEAADRKEVRDVANCRAQALAAVADDVENAVARASTQASHRRADKSKASRPDVRSASIFVRAPNYGGN